MVPNIYQGVANSAAALEGLLHLGKVFGTGQLSGAEILARLRYDQLNEHRRADAVLIRRALVMANRLDAGKARVGAIVEFLAQDVVARHLPTVDRAFFPQFGKAATAPVPP